MHYGTGVLKVRKFVEARSFMNKAEGKVFKGTDCCGFQQT